MQMSRLSTWTWEISQRLNKKMLPIDRGIAALMENWEFYKLFSSQENSIEWAEAIMFIICWHIQELCVFL